MKLVWTESLYQAREMLQTWTSTNNPGITSIAKDMRTLSLNVLAATGFRRSYKFRSANQPESDEAHVHRDALQIVLDNSIFLMLIPARFLVLPLLPASWARIGKAAAAFKQHMVRMLDEETLLLKQGKPGTGSLMTSFVRALDTHQKGEALIGTNAAQSHSKGLTVDEIFGNIFVINFAGHDTTANTLAFSMLLLAAYPEVQNWVAEELHEMTESRNTETWDYNTLFSKLKRCRAVLVRISPPQLKSKKLPILTFPVRDTSALSTHSGTSQVEQRAPTNATNW